MGLLAGARTGPQGTSDWGKVLLLCDLPVVSIVSPFFWLTNYIVKILQIILWSNKKGTTMETIGIGLGI